MKLENIPQELKTHGLFCTWKLSSSKGKVPYNPVTKTYAKSDNKNTFVKFEEVIKYLPEYLIPDENGQPSGGLGLGIFNGYSAVDIDKCRNAQTGDLSPMALDIIDYMKSYTEVSPSGTGIRIIFKTDTKINKSTHYIMNKNIGLEIYISDNTNKFVTLTSDVYLKQDINFIDISYIIEKYMRKQTETLPVYDTSDTSDAELSLKLKNAIKRNPKLKESWEYQASGSGGDESEHDLSLCNMLAFVFEGNYTAIDNAFRESPYFASKDMAHIDKWIKRNDYREDTIKKACNAYHQYKLEKQNEFEFNDTGNAHRFVKIFGDSVRYNVDNKQWMVWNGKYWQTDLFYQVKGMAEIVIEQMKLEINNQQSEEHRKQLLSNIKRALSSGGKEAMLREAQHIDGIPVTNAMFDTEPYYFNCKDGVVDIRTGDIYPHNRNYMLSKYTDISIVDDKPSMWLRFLNEIFGNDEKMIDYVHRIVGYALTGYTKEQCIFIFQGDGSNGKSLLLEVVNKIIGGYATTSSVDILVDRKNHQSNMSEIARLNKMRFVVTDETEMGDKLKESAIKSMTSDHGDITARFLYGNEFTFKPIFKIFMATNHKPVIRGTDHGIWRRIRLIPFNIIIPDSKQDRYLGEKLETEYSMILKWALDGAKLWFNDGLKTPDIMDEAVKDYRSEMDLVQRWIDENCEIDPTFSTPALDLFKDITKYTIENKEFQMSNTLFGRNMGKKFQKRRIGSVTCYIGIRLRTENIEHAIDKVNYAEGLNADDI